MKIHLITNLFAPDELAGAALYSDLAQFLNERGHDVRVTCTFAYYPDWKLREADVGVRCRDERFGTIPLRRVAMHVPVVPSGKGRLLADFSFLISLLRRGRHPGWRPEVVLTAIPMLSQSLAQRFLYAGRRIPRLIVVQDFVVEAALELGILRVPGIAPLLHAVQRWALRSARTLTTISPAMLEKLERVVGPDRRFVFIPNWIHGSLQREINRQRETGLSRQSQALFYSGNIGAKQGLPDFLSDFGSVQRTEGGKAAPPLWSLKIHGGGADRSRLSREVEATPGCELGPVLEEREYIRSLLTCTACLVTQKAGVGANFLPSKLLPALGSGTPVLAVCEASSPLANEVAEGGFGAVVAPGDRRALRSILTRWSEGPEALAAMSECAIQRARLYGRDTVLARYEAELAALVSHGAAGSGNGTARASIS